jgi:predicted nucleic acid-binding protein
MTPGSSVRFTVDASVHLSALNPAEEGSAASRRFLARVHQPPPAEGAPAPHAVFSPTLLLVEIAAAVARVFDDSERGARIGSAIRELPAQAWIPLDDSLTEAAAEVAARRRLRGADAVYAAVARRSESRLVTLDRQQLERLPPAIAACRPDEALDLLDGTPDAPTP